LPYSLRATCSWNIFNEIAYRLRGAMEAASLDTPQSRNLTSTQLSVDELGWTRISEAVMAEFVSIFEEQEDARRRAFHLGENLFRVDAFQISFEIPMQIGERRAPGLVERSTEPMAPFWECLASVIASDVCMKIVAESHSREISVVQFHREFGGSRRTLYRRFRQLEEAGWLQKVTEQRGGRRRGATEHFYRASGPTIAEDDRWAHPPKSLGGTDNWSAFRSLSTRVMEAMRAGTFDARLDRCQAWSLLQLDRQGWQKVVAGIEALRHYILEEQEQARERMKKSGEKPILMMVALGAFESPKELVKAP
jgi:DNA-binding HxlR family transcriptional regulator